MSGDFNARFLVVDDNRICRKLIEAALREFGEADSARDGDEAWEKYVSAQKEGRPFSLITMDYLMPGMNGLELSEKIRGFEESNGIRDNVYILMISSMSDRGAAARAADFCQGFILKPFSAETLRQKLLILGFTPLPAERISKASARELHFLLGDEFDGDMRAAQKETPPPPVPAPVQAPRKAAEPPAAPAAKPQPPLPPLIHKNGDTLSFMSAARDERGEIKTAPISPGEYPPFLNLRKGDVIGRAAGKDSAEGIQAARGVLLIKAAGLFKAAAPGRLSVDGCVLSVTELITVDGDLRAGGIDFTGRVLVRGDVKDNLTVRAEAGVEITGAAGACLIESEGDIRVGRINGGSKAVVRCGGSFTADSVYGTLVECRGDVLISRESVHSVIKSGAAIDGGSVVGGECAALRSVRLRSAGSKRDVHTEISAGVDFRELDALQKKRNESDSLSKELAGLAQMLGGYLAAPERAAELPDAKKERILSLLSRHGELTAALSALKDELASIGGDMSRSAADAKIEVTEDLFHGSVVKIGAKQIFLTGSAKGPLTITENSPDTGLLFQPLSARAMKKDKDLDSAG
jgi:CheY-like chemotaxis protein